MTVPDRVADACRRLHSRAAAFDNDVTWLTRPATVGEQPRPTDAVVRAQVARVVASELRNARRRPSERDGMREFLAARWQPLTLTATGVAVNIAAPLLLPVPAAGLTVGAVWCALLGVALAIVARKRA